MSEIYKNDGGFRLITAGVPTPTVKHTGSLVFDVNLNLPAKDRKNHYAVDVYLDGRFVMRTQEFPIEIRNQDILYMFNHYELLTFTFITQRIVGNKQASQAVTKIIQKVVCANDCLCSNKTICKE